MYDVLNRVAVDSVLGNATAYEVDLAIGHFSPRLDNDLLLYDRNYASYFHLATLYKLGKKFVIRCSAASFNQARDMLKGEGSESQIVTLKPHLSQLKEIKSNKLPKQIIVRFVRGKEETGEYEVLVTNLLDEPQFLRYDFLDIYHSKGESRGSMPF